MTRLIRIIQSNGKVRVQCTVYSVQCKVYSVQCTVYIVQCTLECSIDLGMSRELQISVTRSPWEPENNSTRLPSLHKTALPPQDCPPSKMLSTALRSTALLPSMHCTSLANSWPFTALQCILLHRNSLQRTAINLFRGRSIFCADSKWTRAVSLIFFTK